MIEKEIPAGRVEGDPLYVVELMLQLCECAELLEAFAAGATDGRRHTPEVLADRGTLEHVAGVVRGLAREYRERVKFHPPKATVAYVRSRPPRAEGILREAVLLGFIEESLAEEYLRARGWEILRSHKKITILNDRAATIVECGLRPITAACLRALADRD